jgi:excisionase family DNA binding protein
MDINEISFENLPKAVAYLVSEVAKIKTLVERGQTPVVPQKRVPVGIDDACQIIGKAKPTIYALVRKRLLPCYKNGKKLYFFEDELLEWIAKGKKMTLMEIESEAEANYGNRRKR